MSEEGLLLRRREREGIISKGKTQVSVSASPSALEGAKGTVLS